LPLASLTKLVTAFVVEQTLNEVGVHLGTVTFSKEATQQEGDDGFLIGEDFYVEDLRDVMLLRSSNDAAFALANWVESVSSPESDSFVNKMNNLVAQQGFSATYFLNPTGLDLTEDLSGAYGSAQEVARLFSWILKKLPYLLFATQSSEINIFSLDGRALNFQSSAASILSIPGLIGVKTGFTDLAGGNVVFAFSLGPQRHFVVSVLGSSFNGRFIDALKLYEATKEYIQI